MAPSQAPEVGPQAPEVGPQATEFGPFEFCVWRQLCPFPRSIVGPPPLPRPPGGPSLVIWLRPLEATMPFSMAPSQAPEVGPQAPEFDPFEFCVWRQLCRFPKVHCWPPAPPPALRWHQFGYLAEAPRGNYALFHGPRPAPGLAEVGPQAPEFGPFECCIWRQLYALFPRSIVGPPPLPWPPGGPGLVIWLRATMQSV